MMITINNTGPILYAHAGPMYLGITLARMLPFLDPSRLYVCCHGSTDGVPTWQVMLLQGCHNSNEPKFKAILKVSQGFLANFQGSYIARKFDRSYNLQGFMRTKHG